MASWLAWESNLIDNTSEGLIPLESGLFYDRNGRGEATRIDSIEAKHRLAELPRPYETEALCPG